MGEACEDCSKWEETIYWTHFQIMHFAQFLTQDFHQQLTIPKKFADNLQDSLPKTVALKGPSGITWNVELVTSGDSLLLKNGWEEFAKDQCLKENDFLIFRYSKNSHFDVLVFEKQSLCEKEATYLVRKCGHTKVESGCSPKRDAKEKSVEVIHNSFHDDDDQYTSPKKSRKLDSVMPVSPRKQSIRKRRRMTPRKASSVKTNTAKRILRSKSSSTHAAGEKDECYDSDGGKITINKNQAYNVQYISSRRSVTEDEKEKALQAALSASSKEAFAVVMRPTMVYKRFFMVIPSKWETKHLWYDKQQVILHHNESTWPTKYFAYESYAGLAGGWRHFAVENNLEEFDVCLFELGSQLKDAVVLHVRIFRVVEEVVPLMRLTTP
ncbi:B3 domain-containing protein REM16-like [Malania oleifera]|uniref:B3 domain-containing protein REM16-like n=1 Tax=Malania oleifera TaxID=397392 RepID=UPI0025AE9323|nr:B3 domain-containing protein REM16-like [Malania oleifera]XP_057949841.1 B3 domain-containing protein REM16-like [Malania oleifera]XP_057949843.1 B3 domain-containing protein REM16-like [Malania oleifera]